MTAREVAHMTDDIEIDAGPMQWHEPKMADKQVRVAQVIITTNARRGEGTKESPIRVIKQIWSMDGELIAEVDPFHPIEGKAE